MPTSDLGGSALKLDMRKLLAVMGAKPFFPTTSDFLSTVVFDCGLFPPGLFPAVVMFSILGHSFFRESGLFFGLLMGKFEISEQYL